MKSFYLLLTVAVLSLFSLSACETAHDAAAGSVALAGHAVHKGMHVAKHGVRKVENQF